MMEQILGMPIGQLEGHLPMKKNGKKNQRNFSKKTKNMFRRTFPSVHHY